MTRSIVSKVAGGMIKLAVYAGVTASVAGGSFFIGARYSDRVDDYISSFVPVSIKERRANSYHLDMLDVASLDDDQKSGLLDDLICGSDPESTIVRLRAMISADPRSNERHLVSLLEYSSSNLIASTTKTADDAIESNIRYLASKGFSDEMSRHIMPDEKKQIASRYVKGLSKKEKDVLCGCETRPETIKEKLDYLLR